MGPSAAARQARGPSAAARQARGPSATARQAGGPKNVNMGWLTTAGPRNFLGA